MGSVSRFSDFDDVGFEARGDMSSNRLADDFSKTLFKTKSQFTQEVCSF
jgi:hypothetical protein